MRQTKRSLHERQHNVITKRSRETWIGLLHDVYQSLMATGCAGLWKEILDYFHVFLGVRKCHVPKILRFVHRSQNCMLASVRIRNASGVRIACLRLCASGSLRARVERVEMCTCVHAQRSMHAYACNVSTVRDRESARGRNHNSRERDR